MNKRLIAIDNVDLEIIEREFNKEKELIQTEETSIFVEQKKLHERELQLQKRKDTNDYIASVLANKRYGIAIHTKGKKTLEQHSVRLKGKKLTTALEQAVEESGNSGILEGELAHVFFGQSRAVKRTHLKKLLEQNIIREEATIRGHRYFYVQQEK